MNKLPLLVGLGIAALGFSPQVHAGRHGASHSSHSFAGHGPSHHVGNFNRPSFGSSHASFNRTRSFNSSPRTFVHSANRSRWNGTRTTAYNRTSAGFRTASTSGGLHHNRHHHHARHHHHGLGYGYGLGLGLGYPYGYGYGRPYYASYGNQYDGGATIADVQQALADAGYYRGDIDGVPGEYTFRAIRAFQANNGLPVTGRIDPPLIRTLGF